MAIFHCFLLTFTREYDDDMMGESLAWICDVVEDKMAFDIILAMRNPLRLGIPNKQIQALEPQDGLNKSLLLLIQRLVLMRGTNYH